jgi:putative SOS response-associated peptidase YedK
MKFNAVIAIARVRPRHRNQRRNAAMIVRKGPVSRHERDRVTLSSSVCKRSRSAVMRPRRPAPSYELLVIRRNRDTGEVSLDPLRWGLIPYWCKDPKGGPKPINAKAETVAGLPIFRDAYAHRRCILPVDGFFEWKAIKGLKAKQPFAIAMRDGSPFGIAGIWENWKEPASGEWRRACAIITVPPNKHLAQIHERMLAILGRADYDRWLGDESDPCDLLRPFPSELMRIWPILTRVNKPENDDPSILDPTTTMAA